MEMKDIKYLTVAGACALLSLATSSTPASAANFGILEVQADNAQDLHKLGQLAAHSGYRMRCSEINAQGWLVHIIGGGSAGSSPPACP